MKFSYSLLIIFTFSGLLLVKCIFGEYKKVYNIYQKEK